MDILAVQQRFIDAGFQFIEHIFNDGMGRDCYIRFTRTRSPHAFDPGHERTPDVGWGRYPRMDAWRMAAEWLDQWLEEQEAVEDLLEDDAADLQRSMNRMLERTREFDQDGPDAA